MTMSEPATAKLHPLRKTKAQLFEEVELLRLRVAEFEDAAAARERPARALLESEALLEGEERLDLIINSVPAGISYFDEDQRFQFANQNYKNLLRLPARELIGKTLEEGIGKEAYKIAGEFARRALAGETVQFENTLPATNGEKIAIAVSYVPDIGRDQIVRGFFALVTDITGRKRVEKALQEARDELQLRVDAQTEELDDANQRLRGEIAERISAAARFEALLKAAPDPTISMDYEGKIVEVNAQVEHVLGYRRDELIGREVEILLPEHLRNGHIGHRRQFSRNRQVRNMRSGLELSVLCKDGQELPVEISLSPAQISGSGVVIASIRDVTWRNEIEKALRSTNERIQRLIESTKAIPWEADAKTWRFTYIGPQAEKLLGYPLDQWFESNFWVDHIHPEDRECTIEYRLDASNKREDYEFEYRMIDSDGNCIWFHDIVTVVRENGEPVTLSGFMIDISARKRSEEALQNLSARLIDAQEEERKRVARELHDDFNQRLALVTIDIEQLARERAGSPEDFDGHILDLLGRIEELSLDVHRLSHRLHPSTLVHLGLVTAVKGLCKELSSLHDIRIYFTGPEIPAAVPEDVALCCYRIVQESLRNIIRHSGAGEAHVALALTKQGLELNVHDQGVGFDVAGVESRRGLGLTSMRERLRLVDGQIAIKSSAAHGTQIDVFVPLSAADAV